MAKGQIPQDQLDDLTKRFVAHHGDDCAHVTSRWWQKAWYACVVCSFLALVLYRWDIAFCLATIFFAFWYFAVIIFRVAVVSTAAMGKGIIDVSGPQVAGLRDDELPVFTVLVPLYKEERVADKIIRNLDALDYPKGKLDIKLLLEPDDPTTIEAVGRAEMGPHYDVIVVPDSMPKTKPKACNHGLQRAKGEICVIYDAEDRPDPDQLKKVAFAFANLPDEVACIQAKLNFFNPTQNLLTRWFTIEYSTTFDLYLPGLQVAGIPLPLGGTSNHFRTHVLRECEGWDPFNVTEDCDLGIRIYRRGYKTRMINSTTWEEANSRPWNWVRQRSRWVKGFFQTHLAHMRNPFRTWRELGTWGMFGFLLCVGGSSLMMVLNVFYWLAGGFYAVLLARGLRQGYGLWEMLRGPRDWLPGNAVWPMVYYGPKEDPVWSSLSVAFFVVAVVLFLANLLFVYMHVQACIKRRFYHLIPAALLMPIYWVMISIGAWKGFIQLFSNPFYWEKTHHGLPGAGEDPDAPAP